MLYPKNTWLYIVLAGAVVLVLIGGAWYWWNIGFEISQIESRDLGLKINKPLAVNNINKSECASSADCDFYWLDAGCGSCLFEDDDYTCLSREEMIKRGPAIDENGNFLLCDPCATEYFSYPQNQIFSQSGDFIISCECENNKCVKRFYDLLIEEEDIINGSPESILNGNSF